MSTLFEVLGGEDGIRRIVERFYFHMHTRPEAIGIRQMHPESLEGSGEKLSLYLTGWTGGPQKYVEKYGHPRLRARHLPFKIGKSERDQWLMCMLLALEDLENELSLDADVRAQLMDSFLQLADHMRNVPETDEA